MKTWVRKTLSVGVLAAGALLFGPGVAHADVRQNSYDNNGILNGAQLVAPVSVPVNIVGNAIGVAGEANAAGVGKNFTEGGKVTQNSYDNNGIANGLQGYLPVNVPINVVGNAVAVLGEANAAGAGVNGRKTESATVTEHGGNNGHGRGDQNSWDNNGILNGTQIYAPIDVPINICGNALSLLGEGNAQAVCVNRHGHRTEGAKQNSWDNNGILNGAQVYAPINLPVNLAGNAIGILGEGNAAAAAQNESAHGQGFGQDTHDNNGIGNGLQVAAPISVPVNVCGNALGILGEGNAAASCTNGHGGVKGDGGHGHHHNGNGAANGAGDDDQYMGAGGAQGGGYNDDVAGDNGDDNYGQGRSAKSAEASPVAGLTKNASSVSGLDLLKALG
jgi:small secreted domain DUF320